MEFRSIARKKFISVAFRQLKLALIALLGCALTACTTLGASGPTSQAVQHAQSKSFDGTGILVIELDEASVRRLLDHTALTSFAASLGDSQNPETVIGPGDILEVQVWEAPPAILFGNSSTGYAGGITSAGAQSILLPQQVVDLVGSVNVPFAGRIVVNGLTPVSVEREIVKRLVGRANQPQAVVRLMQNEARTITVLGEVVSSKRVPLGPKGERILDALASAGGPRHPIGKTTLQVTRGQLSQTMPLDSVIRNPDHNIRLQAGDILTVLYQPFSFIALGAVQNSGEVLFEGGGFSLAQAFGRIGGLRDDRADIRGVFVFRLEDPNALEQQLTISARRTSQGRVPVIYRLNMADPASFFIAQDFQLRDKDLVYVSTAPGSDFQRFVSTVSAMAFSTVTIGDALGLGKAN